MGDSSDLHIVSTEYILVGALPKCKREVNLQLDCNPNTHFVSAEYMDTLLPLTKCKRNENLKLEDNSNPTFCWHRKDAGEHTTFTHQMKERGSIKAG